MIAACAFSASKKRLFPLKFKAAFPLGAWGGVVAVRVCGALASEGDVCRVDMVQPSALAVWCVVGPAAWMQRSKSRKAFMAASIASAEAVARPCMNSPWSGLAPSMALHMARATARAAFSFSHRALDWFNALDWLCAVVAVGVGWQLQPHALVVRWVEVQFMPRPLAWRRMLVSVRWWPAWRVPVPG